MTYRDQHRDSSKLPSRNKHKAINEMPAKTVLKPVQNGSASTKDKDGGPKPTHFLAREEGKYTPMIALDELPEGIKIEGLPLYVDTEGLLKWKATACFPATAKHPHPYVVTVEGQEQEGGKSSDEESVNVPSTRALNARLARALGNSNKNQPEAKEILMLPKRNHAGGSAQQRYNPTTPGILGKKLYCTHWMRTGECDFMQQGCMFYHRMPDLVTLEKLGFRSYPRWFREMSRDYQLENATEFHEDGLNPKRLQQKSQSPPRRLRGVEDGNDYNGQERGYSGRDFGKEDHGHINAPYEKNYGYNYGRGEYEYGRGHGYPGYGPPPGPYNHNHNNFQAGPTYPPRGPQMFQGNYRTGPWNAPHPDIPSHQRIWSVNTNDGQPTDSQQYGMPFGRPFVPRAGIPTDAHVTSNGMDSAAVSSPAQSPVFDPTNNDHTFFSRDQSPTSTVNRAHQVLTPSPPSARPVHVAPDATVNRPTFRPLNDGIPPSPEQTYIKRFQNTKPKAFAAPDAKVTAASAAASPASPKQAGPLPYEPRHAAGFSPFRGRSRYFGRPAQGQHHPSGNANAAPGAPAPKQKPGPTSPTVKKENGANDAEPLMDVNPKRQ